MSEFLAMSGYAAYVWPSIGLCLAALLLNIHWARRLLRQSKQDARRRIASAGEP